MCWPALRQFVFLLTIAFFACANSNAKQGIDSTYGPLPVFEFHSGFWVNLHHTLYHEARQRTAAPGAGDKTAKTSGPALKFAPGSTQTLTAAEHKLWDDAVSFYAANYADKDLLFSTELLLLKNQLGDFEDCDELTGKKKKSCDAGLPGKIGPVLEAAAPVYRAHWWADHDRANRRWVARVAPLVREQGVGLSQRLADIYQAKWPKEKIRVDVSAWANVAGAYTTLDPLRVTISSTDPRNQGAAALEVVFHEASHGISQPVQLAITRQCRQHGKPIPRDLWHALIFYTTGEVIKPVMAEAAAGRGDAASNDDYVPYAVREGLYHRGWDGYLKLLTNYWQPYLDNKVTFDDAIARMVSAL
jgi:hypothetical protein